MEKEFSIRFDFSEESKAKDFFVNARKYLADNNLEKHEKDSLIKVFKNTTNAVYDCYGNFINGNYFEDWLDICEVVLENESSVLSQIFLRFIGDIGKKNSLFLLFMYDSDDVIHHCITDVLVQEDIKTYEDFAETVVKEMKVLRYIYKRGIAQNDVLNFEQIRKDILFDVNKS